MPAGGDGDQGRKDLFHYFQNKPGSEAAAADSKIIAFSAGAVEDDSEVMVLDGDEGGAARRIADHAGLLGQQGTEPLPPAPSRTSSPKVAKPHGGKFIETVRGKAREALSGYSCDQCKEVLNLLL